MKLSKNFTLKEMIKSDTATRLGIPNIPSNSQINNLRNLCENVLQPTREEFGRLNVNSGYRSPELCEIIGSSRISNHASGFAADIEPDDANETFVTNFQCLRWIAENLQFKELIAEYFDKDDKDAGWIHVAYQEGNNKGIIKLKDKNHNYKIISLDDLIKLYGEE